MPEQYLASRWAQATLSTVFRINTASMIPALAPNEIFTHYSIPAFDLTGGPAEELGAAIESNKTRISEPSLLVSKLNPRKPRVVVVSDPSDRTCCSTEFICYVPVRADDDLRYWAAYLGSGGFSRRLERVAVGSTNSHTRVTPSETLKWLVSDVPAAEQKLIADILDAIDDAIIETDAVIAKLTALKLGLVEDLCGVEILSAKAAECSSGSESFESGPLSRWLLGLEQGWSPDCDDEPTPGGSWGVLKTTSVVWSGWDTTKNKRLPPELKPRPSLEVHAGDILMTRAGPAHRVGVVSYVNETQEQLMLSDKLYRLIPSPDFRPDFLGLILATAGLQKQISSFKVGMAQSQMNISQADVKKLAVIKPPLAYQTSAVDGVSSLDEQLKVEATKLAKLHSLRYGLRDDLLTGRKLVVAIQKAAE